MNFMDFTKMSSQVPYMTGIKQSKSTWSKEEIQAAIARRKQEIANEKALYKTADIAVANIETENSVALQIITPQACVKVTQVLGMLDPSTKLKHVILAGLFKAGLKLRQVNLIVALPPVIKRKAIKKREDRNITHHVMKPFPRPQSPVNMEKSAQLFDIMNKTKMREYVDYMRMAGIQYRIPFMAVDTHHVISPLPKDFYATQLGSATSGIGGTTMREMMYKFIASMSAGSRVAVLWGDSGNMIPTLSSAESSISIDVFSFRDWEVLSYDMYLSFVVSAMNRNRFSLIEINQGLKEYVSTTFLDYDYIIYNYLPLSRSDFLNPRAMLYSFGKIKPRSPMEDKNQYIDLPPGLTRKDARHYVEMFHTAQMLGTGSKKKIFRDLTTGMTVGYDYHQAWVDFPVRKEAIPLAQIVRAKQIGSYDGSIGLEVVCAALREIPFRDFVSVPTFELPAIALDYQRALQFNCDDIVCVDYLGPINFLGKSDKRYIDGFIFFCIVEGQYYFLDASLGGQFLDRYLFLLALGLPMVPFIELGNHTVSLDASVGNYYSVTYEDTDDVNEVKALTVGSLYGEGLAFDGQDVVYDGCSVFTYNPYSALKELTSESPLSWRVRFKRRQHVRVGQFWFLDISNGGYGLCPIQNFDFIKCPDEWRQMLLDVF